MCLRVSVMPSSVQFSSVISWLISGRLQSIYVIANDKLVCTFLEERASGAASARVRVRGGAAEHRPVVVLLVWVSKVIVVVEVVDALPVLALPAAVAPEAPQLLLPQQPQGLRRLDRQVALPSYIYESIDQLMRACKLNLLK